LFREAPVNRLSLVISIVVLIAAVNCGDSDNGGEFHAGAYLDGGSTKVAFDDFDHFLVSEHRPQSDDPKVVFIGIDGAAWEFIDPLIESGVLPNLRRLVEGGARARLRSIPCFVSPPAWASMLTGCTPRKTGVYSYGKWDRSARKFDSVNADDVRMPSIWDMASYCGNKVGVFNVPMTYPPRPVNGVMVSGMMTPYEMGNPPDNRPNSNARLLNALRRTGGRSYSPVTRTATDDSLNAYLWSLYDTVDDKIKSYNVAVLAVVSMIETIDGRPVVDFYTFDVGEFSPWIQVHARRDSQLVDAWCKLAVIKTLDGRYETRSSPQFYDIEQTYTYPDTFATVLKSQFGYYVPSAFVSDELVPSLTRDAASRAAFFYDMDDWDLFLYVFTQSDNIHHLTGFSPAAVEVYKKIDRLVGRVLDRLPDNGTLVVASDHGFRKYSRGIDLNRFFTELGLLRWSGTDEIDYEDTIVFHNIWHLYFNHDLINREELSKRGIAVPSGQDPLPFFTDYMQRALETIVSPDGRMLVTAEPCDEPESREENLPDMFVQDIPDDYLVDFLGFAQPHSSVIHILEGADQWWHIRDGIFLAKGKGVRRGYDAGTLDIQDIAPTLLFLLGLPATSDMDGVIAQDIFERSYMAGQNAFVVESYPEVSREPVPHDLARESLEKKMKSLGYIR